jgi:hypothetical protein
MGTKTFRPGPCLEKGTAFLSLKSIPKSAWSLPRGMADFGIGHRRIDTLNGGQPTPMPRIRFVIFTACGPSSADNLSR